MPSSATKIAYEAMPGFVKSVAVSLYGLRNNRIRRGTHFATRYRELMSNMLAGREELDRRQGDALERLLRDAYEYSPFYRQSIVESVGPEGLESEFDPFAVLDRLPLLEKSDLRDHMAEVLSRDPQRRTVTVTHTSGTTGTPMSVEVDSESLQWTFAEWERYYRWMGLPQTFRSVRLSGRIVVAPDARRPPYWATNWASRQLFMSTYHLRSDSLPAYIQKLNGFRPLLIDGYPSAVEILARYINESGIQLKFAPIAISTTAETLQAHQRDEIERAFRCPVYNQYASSEGAPWIVQCSHGSYHLWTDTGVFEFLNQRRTSAGDVLADLVVTSFRAMKTPLIRYNIGDTVRLQDDAVSCPCGSAFPTIGGVIGREEDVLHSPQRGFVGRLDTAYKGLPGIVRSKITQTDENRIEVLVIPTAEYTHSAEAKLISNLRDRLGDMDVAIYVVDDIPVGRSGKFKAVENRVKP